MLKILVTGCGRSGTQYMHSVLSILGIKACHERIFHHGRDHEMPINDVRALCENAEYQAACSWLAAPFVPSLPEQVTIWHQCRDPLKVARCWAWHKLLGSPSREANAAGKYVHRVLPECESGGDMERAMKYVARWNRLVQGHANIRRYRVEDITAPMLHRLLLDAGFDVPLEKVVDAIERTSRRVGGCGNHGPDWTWESVSQTPGGVELLLWAQEAGYA